jgi:tRNA(Arg) A34 adenosine deaminase TadA
LSKVEQIVWMNRALELAAASVVAGNHPFGAVLVSESRIVLEAQNTVITDRDPTRHAEMNLVSAACKSLPAHVLKHATVVTSTEPCAMCLSGIYWAGIKCIIFGCPASVLETIAGASLRCSSHAVFENTIDPPVIQGPLLESQAIRQHKAYWK